MDEARSQLLIRKGLLIRPRVTGDTRGARDARRSRSFALARIGRFRPRRPSSMSSRPGLAPRASPAGHPWSRVTQTLWIGNEQPEKRPAASAFRTG